MTKKMTFREQVVTVVEAQEAVALDQVGVLAQQAIRDVIRQLVGARWNHWHDKWEFENSPRRGDMHGSAMLDAIEAKAERLAPQLVDEALKEPIVFTKADLAKLRASLKEAVLAAASDVLNEKALLIAEEIVKEMTG